MRVAWTCWAGVGDTLSLSQPGSRIYHDHGVLFCWPDGGPPHPDTITRRSKQLAAAAGLPEIDLHGVRHSYATADRDGKIDRKALSKRIGHADVAFTMKQYPTD